RLADVGRADGAEELAFATCLGTDRQLEAFKLRGTRLRCLQLLLRKLLELSTASLELGDVLRSSQRRLALRQQIVTPVTGLDLDAIADIAEVGDLLQQNQFHNAPFNYQNEIFEPSAAGWLRSVLVRATLCRAPALAGSANAAAQASWALGLRQLSMKPHTASTPIMIQCHNGTISAT